MFISIHNSTPTESNMLYYLKDKILIDEQYFDRVLFHQRIKETVFIAAVGIFALLRAVLFYKYGI